MKKDITIPIKIERLKTWTRWVLEVTSWLIGFGLLAASVGAAAGGALVWLLFGSETVLTLGIISGLLLGFAGVWQVLRQINRSVEQLQAEEPAAG